MICIKCGNQIDVNAKFCSYCGNISNDNDSLRVCPNCKNETSYSSKFCSHCGNSMQDLKEEDLKDEFMVQTDLPHLNTSTSSTNRQVSLHGANNNNINNSKGNKKRAFIIIFVVVLLFVGLFFLSKFLFNKFTSENGEKSSIATISKVKDANGTVKYIDGAFTDIIVRDKSDAFDALDSLKDELNFNNVKENFNIESVNENNKITYYKFRQKYKGVEVYGDNLIIAVDSNGKVLSMSGYYIPNINIDVNYNKTKEELGRIISDNNNGIEVNIYDFKKYIYSVTGQSYVVYIVDAASDDEAKEYVIDAISEVVINSYDLLESSSYSANLNGINDLEEVTIDESSTIFGTSYSLKDPNRNILIADGMGWKTGLLSSFPQAIDPQYITGYIEGNDFKYSGKNVFNKSKVDNETIAKMGVTALKKFEEIYDYYYNVLKRNSYDGEGGNIIVNVNMDASKNGGAAWNKLTKQVEIGFVGDVSTVISKDILVHEFTHGVVDEIVDFASMPKNGELNNAFETGALNEGIPDIFGCLIEGDNWTIGEDIAIIRDLENPEAFKKPAKKGELYFFPDYYLKERGETLEEYLMYLSEINNQDFKNAFDVDKGGSHLNATIPGYAAYLMYSNGAFTSKEQMAEVWYNALFLLSSYSDFEDCALAVIQSAKNMGLSAKSISVIEDAFMETKMLQDNRIIINGMIRSGTFELGDAKVEFKGLGSETGDYTFNSVNNGEFDGKIRKGTYEVIVSKNGFNEYRQFVTLYGDTAININLERVSKQKHNEIVSCRSTNCHTITIYFLEALNNAAEENYEIYSVDDGTVIGTDVLINSINNSFGSNLIGTDGENFYISIAGFEVDFAWYYVGTDIKFDFNEPITENVEIEMKLFDGELDNSFMKDVYDLFSQ